MNATLPLGAIDVFHLVHDRLMRSRGLAGNHCAFVLALEGRLDPAALERRLGAACEAVPELRARLRGPFRLRWQVDPKLSAPRPALRSTTSIEPELGRLLAERVDGDRPWAIDLVRDGENDTLVFRHFHPLADARATERLVRFLGSGPGDIPDDPPPPAERFGTSDRLVDKLDGRARGELAQAYNRHVVAIGRTPILSLASLAPGRGQGGATSVLRAVLSVEETRAFDLRVRKKAKLAETSVLVLAALRATDAHLVRRGYAPPRHLVHVPLSLDPKAGCRRMLGNNLTMMTLALGRDELRDEPLAYARLAEQQRELVRQKLDVGMIAAASYARHLPAVAHGYLTSRPFGGELASVVVSNPGAITVESFAGLRVRDAFLAPTVVLPPGVAVITSRFAGRLSVVLVTLDTVLPPKAAAGMLRDLRRELLPEGAPAAVTV